MVIAIFDVAINLVNVTIMVSDLDGLAATAVTVF